ncbi:MAG TPA: outer membrane beta-barrel protein [Thermoanaerobaculia bacterium]
MRASRVALVGLLLIAGLIVGGASAPVVAQGHFGVTAGFYQPEESDADLTEVYGIRGGYRFDPRFGFEGSVTRVDLADAFDIEEDPFLPDFNLEIDITNFDFSLQWFPGGGNFVVFGGPGVALIDADVSVTIFGQRFSESDSSNVLTAHAGLGYTWQIGDRFFIRPEARVRAYFDDELDEDDDFAVSYEAVDYEAGLTFGWRF